MFKKFKFLRLILPIFAGSIASAQYTPNGFSANEGATNIQVEMPSGYSIYKILRPPYDSITNNVVGTFLNATTGGQTTSSTATFFFNPSSPDYFGTFYVDWNGTDANTGVVTEHTKDNASNNYLSIPITSTNDAPVLSTGQATSNNSSVSVTYNVNEGDTIVALASATDADGGNPDINVTGGADAALFQYLGGQIIFNSSSGFDYEFPQQSGGVNNTYVIEVSATDSNHTSQSPSIDTQTITIVVADKNDPPEIVQGDSDLIVTIDEDQNPTSWAEATGGNYALTVSDIDSTNFTWSVSSAARNGTATITDNNNNCTIVYTPTADIWGQDTASSPTTGQTGVADKFIVSVSDGASSDEITIRVIVNPIDNDNPVITYTAHTSIPENNTSSIYLTGTDLDSGSSLSWTLSGGDDSSRFNLSSSGELSFASSDDINFEANASFDLDSNFSFTATLTDNLGQAVSRDFSLFVLDVNEPPVIDQGDIAMNVPMYEDNASSFSVTLSATDPDIYSANSQWGALSWSVQSAPTYGNAYFSSVSDPTSLSYTPNAEFNGLDFFTVKVSDSEFFDTIDINVTVSPSDDPPVFDPNTYDGNTSVVLQKSENSAGNIQVLASDLDGGNITYSIHHGDDKDFFEINSTDGFLTFKSPYPDFENPADLNKGNNYEVTVAASDGNGSAYQNFTIEIINSYEPAFFTSSSTYSVNENQTAVGTVTVSDVDVGDIHNFTIQPQSYPDDGSKFDINSTTGVLSFVSALDFESNSSTDGNNTYNFIVRATDLGMIPSDLNITVNLQDDNDQPSLATGNTALFSLEENSTAGTVIADFNVTDQDTNQSHVWSFNGGGDNDYFEIDSSTGQLSLLNPLDFDSPVDADGKATFELSIVVTDSHTSPLVSSPLGIQVILSDVNEPPYLKTDSFSPIISMSEDNSSSFLSPSWVAVDPETNSSANILWYLYDKNTSQNTLSMITDKGSVVTIGNLNGSISYVPAADLNLEINGSEYITVVFQDAGGLEDNQTIQIDVSSINDAPEITAPSPFNSSIDHKEGILQVIDFNASDFRDQGLGSTHFTDESYLTWGLSGTDAASFEISSLGVLNFLVAPVYNGTNSLANRFTLDVSVADLYGGSSSYSLVINVQNSPEAPVLNGSPPVVTISEDEIPISWESVWVDLNVTDPDAGNLEWFIETNGIKGTATVEQYTGAINYIPNLNLFGTDSFVVRIEDSDDMNLTVAVTVEISPVNDPPIITDSNSSGYSKQEIAWPENTPVSDVIRTFLANDGNDSEYARNSFTWGLSSTDSDDFSLDSNGNLRFKSIPNFENPTDSNTDNLYDINVTVTDDNIIFSSYTLYVRVTNMSEPPVFSSLSGQASASVSVSENQTSVYTASATASDINANTISYSIGSGSADNALFQIGGTSGVLTFKSAPDFENSTASGNQNEYIVEVNATDSSSFATQTVTVSVLDVNEAPTFKSSSSYSLTHPENNSSFSLKLGDYITDDNNASVFEYSIQSQDSKLFTVNSATGLVSLSSAPDFENPTNTNLDNNYTATFKIKDGTHEISQMFNLLITNENDPPSLVGSNFTQISVDENTPTVSAFEVNDQDSQASLLDVVMVVENQSIEFSLNSGSTSNRFVDGVAVTNLANASFSKTADFDRDGDIDILLIKKNSGSIEIFENNGSGGFSNAPISVLSDTQSFPQHAVVADLDEDGYPDIVVALKGSSKVAFYRNSAATNSISFESSVSVGTNLSGVSHVQVGDLDTDGDLDVMAIAETANEVQWFKNEGPLYFETNASDPMKFILGEKLQTSQLEVNSPRTTTLGDLDQDGDLDVVVASSMDGNFTSFLNDGNGSFGLPQRLYKEINGEAQLVELVDLNKDNKLDLVLVTKNPNKLGVMLQSNAGQGTFGVPTFFYTGSFFVNSFEVGDLDKDGNLDIVAASSSDSNLYWFSNDGLGQFTIEAETIASSRESILSIALADIDQTNQVLAFKVESNSTDSDDFVFRPKFSGNLFFKQSPDYETRLDDNNDNQYEIQIKIYDENNETDLNSQALQKVVVNVNNLYEPPKITAPNAGKPFYTSIMEHTFVVVDVNSSNDEELYESTSYSISGGIDAKHFSIDSVSGMLSFSTEPDYEIPVDDSTDGNNSYVVIVRASDDGPGSPAYTEQKIYVQVLNGNDAPLVNFTQTGVSINLPEDTQQTISLNSSDLNASDPEGGAISWNIDQNSSLGTSSISGNNLIYSPNLDANGSDSVLLKVMDDNNLSSFVTINFTINPINDPPVITTSNALTHPENTSLVTTLLASDADGDVLSWSLVGGADASSFSLTKSGVLSFVTSPDYETPDSNDSDRNYLIQAAVNDGNTTIDRNFTISVTDENDLAPIVYNLDTNASTLISIPEMTSFIRDLNVSETEGDNVVFSISGGADFTNFNINQSGTLSFQSLPDYENPQDSDGDNLYLFDLNISDGINDIIRSVVVSVENLNEDEPKILNASGTASNPLAHPENQAFVLQVNASDDLNETLTFSLSGGMDSAFFDMNASSGILSFKTEHLPDFENNQSTDGDSIYEVQIQVADSSRSSFTSFYFGITNVDEFPQVSPSSFTVNEDESTILNLVVFDPEGDSFVESFSKGTSFGTLTKTSGIYHYLSDPNFNGIDDFEYQVSDGNESRKLIVTINVLPVDDPPSAVEDHFNYDDPQMKSITLNVIENDSNAPDENGTEPIYVTGWKKSWSEGSLDGSILFDSVTQKFTFSPPTGYIGPVSFTYTLSEGDLNSTGSATVHLNRSPDVPDWRYLSNFGFFSEQSYPWIFHSQLGWVYVSENGGENSSSWMWSEQLGWFWTGNNHFPHLYSDEVRKWYFWELASFYPQDYNIPAMYDYSSNKKIGLFDFQLERARAKLTFFGNVTSVAQFIQANQFFSSSQKQSIIGELIFKGSSDTLDSLIEGTGE